MAALVTLLLLGWLALVWCCSPPPGAINIARNGNASQVSTVTGPPIGYAKNAIDGGKDQIWMHGSCSHTVGEMDTWWKLDLLETYNVYMIVVYGRSEEWLSRMDGVEIRVGNSPDNNNPLCGTITDYNNTITTFCCNGMEGRYINAVIPGRYGFLTLCEVEVYNGTRTENDICW